jgi:photosystem II stability/assembly factor-like uncharacterized protein
MIRWPRPGIRGLPAVALAVVLAITTAGCSTDSAKPGSTARVNSGGRGATAGTTAPRPDSALARRRAGSPVWIDTLQMTSLTTGWALLWPSNPSRSSALAVARTTDGGATWTVVTPPPAVPALTAGQALLEAATAQRAWFTVTASRDGAQATRTHVFGTTDGGRSWRESPPVGGGQDPVAIDFAGPDRGWLLDSPGAAMGQNPVSLYRSSDGGVRWALVAKSPRMAGDATTASGLPVACDKDGLAFATARVGWITGYCPVGADVLASTDGGARWATVSQPALGQQCQGGCEIPAPELAGGRVFLLAGSYPASADLLVSADAGQTWRVSPMPEGAGPYPRVRFFTADDGIAVAAGSQGRIGRHVYLTTDAGLTWSAVRLGRRFRGNWTDFDFASLRAGFSWTSPGGGPVPARLLRTSDSGRLWTSVVPRLSSQA